MSQKGPETGEESEREEAAWRAHRPPTQLVLALAVVLCLLSLGAIWGVRGRRFDPTGAPAPDPQGGVLAAPNTAPTRPAATSTTIALSTALPLPGCPPPPYTGPKPGPPWHPTVLVPDSQLPAVPTPTARVASTAALSGKGMWIWEYSQSAGGNAAAVVQAARQAGLHQLWVRVADSQSGFYAAAELDELVPAAHRAGLAVIGWGFPYLYDPVADARWTSQVLNWRSPGGDKLDGFSADIETASEGVDLSAVRVTLYLGLVRRAHPRSLLVATVFPPTDEQVKTYPYRALAPYVDALAPMVYWGCNQPVLAAEQALSRLSPLAPVHLIGQAYDMGPVGGRQGEPTPQEVTAFLEAARRGGALGASFWSWQAIDEADWLALSAYRW